MGRGRAGRRLHPVVAIVVCVTAACGAAPTGLDAADSTIAPRVVSDETVDAASIPSATPTPPSPTAARTPVPAPAPGPDPLVVDRCTESLRLQAFVGDAEAVAIWRDVGGDEPGLHHFCAGLAVDDPARASQLVDELTAFEAAAGAASDGGCEADDPGCGS